MSTCRTMSFAAALAVLLAAASPTRADLEPTDDSLMPTIQTAEAHRFTVPPRIRPAVVYRIRADFDSDREQSLTLYEWVQDDDRAGHWQRRALYNTHMQGRKVMAELELESGRTYLLAAHYKRARSPGYGLPWYQSTLALLPKPTDAGRFAPSFAARFSGAEGAAINVSFVPIEPEAAPDVPKPSVIKD